MMIIHDYERFGRGLEAPRSL